MKRKLLVSRIQTPDGTILTSRHNHDFIQYQDKNGEIYMLDGGPNELGRRTSVNKEKAKDVSLYSDSPWEELRQNIVRGTFDEYGNRIYKNLCDLTDEHLKNILIYNKELGRANDYYNTLVRREQRYRKKNNIVILDE